MIKKLPKALTTVTPFSKYLAIFLFLIFLFTGFYLATTLKTKNSQTANWKTFSADNNLYSFMYPSDWTQLRAQAQEGCGPVFYPPNTKDIWLSVCGPYPNTLEGTAAGSRPIGSKNQLSETHILINDHKGIQQEGTVVNSNYYNNYYNVFIGDIKSKTWFNDEKIEHKTGTLGIYFNIQDKSRVEEAKKWFDQILSTFRFSP